MLTPKFTIFALLDAAAGVLADDAPLAPRQISIPSGVLSNLPSGIAGALSGLPSADPTKLLSLISSGCSVVVDSIPTPTADLFNSKSLKLSDIGNLDKLCMTTPPALPPWLYDVEILDGTYCGSKKKDQAPGLARYEPVTPNYPSSDPSHTMSPSTESKITTL